MKSEWTWNITYKNLYKRPKSITRKYVSMAFYSDKEQLYLETDALGVSLTASFPQVWDGMWFPKE